MLGVIRDCLNRFKVSSAGSRSWHQSDSGNLSIDAGKNRDEMCLECLDGAFGLVAAVVTGGYELVLHAVPRDAFLERVGCLIVEFVFSQS